MVTVVMVDRNPPRLEQQDEPKRASRSARPQLGQPVRSEPKSPASRVATPSAEQRPTSDPGKSDRYRRISLGAYFRAEKRGFEPGHAWEDWLAAEREVDGESQPGSTSGHSGSTK
jgi:hypothetical protein